MTTHLFAKPCSRGLRNMLTMVAMSASLAASAQTYKVIHDFTNPGGSYRFSDGSNPATALTLDTHGNLFGVAPFGGNDTTGYNSGAGVVFELSPVAGGGWKKTILHTFRGAIEGSNHDGASPEGGLVFDGAGNLYGTTEAGGSGGNVGTVYELSPNGSGGWTYSILYSFKDGADGATPLGNLVLDASGNLYGTAQGGGTSLFGVVYKLSPGSGGWTETVLYSFTGGSDGAYPNSGVIFDGSGSLYGTTSYGGDAAGYAGFGVVFRLSPNSSSGWTESVLHSFHQSDGAVPEGNLVFDASGNLYGAAYQGGNLSECNGAGCGVVFELSPAVGGWTETVIHSFQGGNHGYPGYGGGNPYAGLTFDAAGNLYGTTAYGGRTPGHLGVVFKLAPSSTGWIETVLHAFFGGTDGGEPISGVTRDGAGNLFGTAYYGGITTDCGGNGCGVVFEITP